MAGLSVLVVLLYVLLAKSTFEQDKISYVYDTQQTQADLLANSISQRIEKATLQASLLAGEYIRTGHAPDLSSQTDPTFEVLAYDLAQARVVFHVAKGTKSMTPATVWPRLEPQSPVSIIVRDPNTWDLITLVRNSTTGASLYVMVPITLGQDFSTLRDTQEVILSSQSDLAPARIETSAFLDVRGELAAQVAAHDMASTFELDAGGEPRLVSMAFLTAKPYRILILSKTQEALAALQLLFKRSAFFLLFSVSMIFGLSFLLSGQLTGALSDLSEETERVGTGDFGPGEGVRSNDEIGQLSQAFEIMKSKIVELLAKTKETARMEQELKTTKLVQESLFPKKSLAQVGDFTLSGYFQTSTECGGDWWYYFTKGDDLYVAIADATGHGTPAALITATARSCFSFFEKNPLPLPDMMNEWSDAVAACSNQRVFMTAMIFKFNVKTGAYEYLNASHEPPFKFRNERNLFYAEPLDVERGKTLGEDAKVQWNVKRGQLAPSEKMMIFTDGLFAVTDPQGNLLSEKRVLKQLQELADSSQGLEDFAGQSMGLFEAHRQGAILPDDITAIFIERAKGEAPPAPKKTYGL